MKNPNSLTPLVFPRTTKIPTYSSQYEKDPFIKINKEIVKNVFYGLIFFIFFFAFLIFVMV